MGEVFEGDKKIETSTVDLLSLSLNQYATRGNMAGVGGQTAAAVIEEAHAISCERGQWVCNVKRLIETAGLSSLNALFAEIPTEREHLLQWVDLVADGLGVRSSEVMPWRSRTV
jgi:hypothetical protein